VHPQCGHFTAGDVFQFRKTDGASSFTSNDTGPPVSGQTRLARIGISQIADDNRE
jgi:hypothetical protein